LAYALKNYKNSNVQYKRVDKRSKLEILIDRFSKEPSSKYKMNSKKSFMDKSVQKLAVNSIIEGYFPKEKLVKEMAIKRVNKMLCVAISLLIAVVVISYYFVISCEMKLNDLSRQTAVLGNENEELQNKLDSLKSFSNVDKTLQQSSNGLERAGKVIETREITSTEAEETLKKTGRKRVFHSAIGF